MTPPAAITELVERFGRNLDVYKRPDYKETRVRVEFVDPFFEALGWDVRNVQGYAEQYKDVIHEDAIKVGGVVRAPDYCFRVGGTRKFFLEVKKPAVYIKEDVAPAYQLRRYAWSAKLPLSILTDFEEFAVYDCRRRPQSGDKVGVGRVMYVTFDQYLERFDEIHAVFARESVLKGSFDRYAEQATGKRGTAEVDTEFLKEIEGWRDVLARNIALRNPGISVHELNFGVQRTIDRIIFLRICEDRGIEPYGRLMALAHPPAGSEPAGGSSIYTRLQDLYRQAEAKYNSGIFDFEADGLTKSLTIDDKALKPILADLYYPQSPYEFSVLPADILGQVYEQFLGKVVRLTPAHRAVVEEKPEVKKAGGVYYTPTYIVDYIVKQTVGKLVEGKTPRQIAGTRGRAPLRILDPACGSGSFLLGAYQYLLDYHRQWYEENDPAKYAKGKQPAVYQAPSQGAGRKGDWRLTTAEKKRILLDHIYGVDIDRQAVEVTKLSLLLKVLEGESDESIGQQLSFFQERALPNLDDNIKCGNSLIGPDYFAAQLLPDEEEMRRVNAFDWEAEFPSVFRLPKSSETLEVSGGFDCVIGNPPYIRMESFKEFKEYLKSHYASHDERSDLYAYFVECAHKLLASRGRFGMIISNKFLRAKYGKPLRGFLNQNATIERVVDFAGLPVFVGATVRTIIMLTKRKRDNKCMTLYSPPLPVNMFSAVVAGSLSVQQAIEESTYEVMPNALTQPVWSFAKPGASALLTRLRSTYLPLEDYCTGQIGYGIKSGLEKAFVIDGETRDKILSCNKEAAEIIKPYLSGRDIRQYRINFRRVYLIYTYRGIEIEKYPAIIEYLKPFKNRLQKRATKQKWYELQQPQFNYAPYFDGPKIVFPDIATSPRFALDEIGYYGATTIFFISQHDLYLLGLLNSQLSYFYFSETCAALEGKGENYLRFKRQYVRGFPVRAINLNDPADAARHDRMVALVEQMLALHQKLAAATIPADKKLYQRQIETTDRQIDALVYELYGLTEEEIEIVEHA